MNQSAYDLSPTEAAALLGVHPRTLKKWATSGVIRAMKTPGLQWKFSRSDIDAFIAAHVNQPAAAEASA